MIWITFYLLRQFYAKISGTSPRSWRDQSSPSYAWDTAPPLLLCSLSVLKPCCGCTLFLSVSAEDFSPNISLGPPKCYCPPHYPVSPGLIHITCLRLYSPTQLFFPSSILPNVFLKSYMIFILLRIMVTLVAFLYVLFLFSSSSQKGFGCCLSGFASNALLSS